MVKSRSWLHVLRYDVFCSYTNGVDIVSLALEKKETVMTVWWYTHVPNKVSLHLRNNKFWTGHFRNVSASDNKYQRLSGAVHLLPVIQFPKISHIKTIWIYYGLNSTSKFGWGRHLGWLMPDTILKRNPSRNHFTKDLFQ